MEDKKYFLRLQIYAALEIQVVYSTITSVDIKNLEVVIQ